MQEHPKTVLTVNQAAERLGVSPRTLRRWSQSGEGPRMIKLSERRIGVRQRDLDDWLEQRPQG
jgi:excisionase family DNA binding protein